MSRGVNRVILLGNVGRDPEIRYTQTGMAVANFTLATTERVKRKEQWEDQTEWHNCVAWGKTAETCHQYAKKGTQIYVEGKIQTRKWQDKEGNNRYTTEIIINQLVLLGKGSGAAAGPGARDAGRSFDAPQGSSDPFPETEDIAFDPNDDVPF